MDIAKYLTLGADLETKISALYQKIAPRSRDEAMAKTLFKISHEELNHASALKMGLNFLREAPEALLGTELSEEELNLGLNECLDLDARIGQSLDFLGSLEGILRIEKRFEKVHIGASLMVSDDHLKQLFQALAKGDENHIKTLQEMIAGLKTV